MPRSDSCDSAPAPAPAGLRRSRPRGADTARAVAQCMTVILIDSSRSWRDGREHRLRSGPGRARQPRAGPGSPGPGGGLRTTVRLQLNLHRARAKLHADADEDNLKSSLKRNWNLASCPILLPYSPVLFLSQSPRAYSSASARFSVWHFRLLLRRDSSLYCACVLALATSSSLALIVSVPLNFPSFPSF